MQSTKKRIALLILTAIYTVTLFSGLGFLLTKEAPEAFAAETDDKTYSYYYDHLFTTDNSGKEVEYTLAKRFYDVLGEINKSGDFKKGVISYELTQLLTTQQIKAWVEDGNLEIPRAFGAARDCFLMDHPELFYIDVYKIMISAGYTGGNYVAYIDSGEEANVYRDKSFQTEQAVNDAIAEYNAAVKKVADDATKKVADFTAKRDLALAVAVNEVIATQTLYDFGTYNDALEGKVSSASMVFTSYGALVKEKAVCSGYALAYKAVMDYLNIPCVVVSGYSTGKDKKGKDTGNQVGHSWNYVLLETAKKTVETDGEAVALSDEANYEWFAFDTTWNSVQREKNKYSVLDYVAASKEHIPFEVISSSNYSLRYPTLATVDYEKAIDPDNKMDIDITVGDFTYKGKYKPAETTYMLEVYVSYKGMNAKQLLNETGERIITRSSYLDPTTGEKTWTRWQDIVNSEQHPALGFVSNDEENNTFVYVTPYIHCVEFAVVSDALPDMDVWSTGQEGLGYKMEKVMYTENALKEENFVFVSQEFENDVYGTYTAAPYILSEGSTPYMCGVLWLGDGLSESGDSSIMQDKYATVITLKYDEPLHVLDESKPIGISFTPEFENARQYAGFVAFSDGAYVHLLEDENGVPNTLQFKFKPSLMYAHDRTGYGFFFSNVGSSKLVEKKDDAGNLVKTTSDKTPNYAYFVWARNYIACPKVFGDGRLWIECCARPVLVDNSDLSAMNFKDENDNSTFSESERSQMMLVVNSINPATQNSMLNEIDSSSEINVSKEDIKASQTYDIKLQICGKIATIPYGSYVKIALGFPEGYGPDDEGTTFKLFHRKYDKTTDTYSIEEVPCVVTKFGIVAAVTSFSPYMVAVVPKDKVTSKTIYASIDGKGGTLTLDDGQIQSLKEGGSYTYTIEPDEGYKLYSVTLNGKDVKDKIANGKLTLTYDELAANNELKIKYISNEAAIRYEEKNIVKPVEVLVSTDGTSDIYDNASKPTTPTDPTNPSKPVTPTDPTNPTDPADGPSKGLIAGIIVGVFVVIAAAAITAVILIKKRDAKEKK